MNEKQKQSLFKVLKGLAISLGAAAATYLTATLDMIDTDVKTPLVMVVFAVLINTLKVVTTHFSKQNDRTDEG